MNKLLISFLILGASACAVNKSTKSMHPYSGGSLGCGNFIVYKLSEDNTEYVSVILDVSSIELTQVQAYALGKAEVVQVIRKKFSGPIDASLCNDVMKDRPEDLLEEKATQGIVEVRINEAEREKALAKQPYNVTVILKNVIFGTMTIDYLRVDSVNVGWLPG